jgi:muconolactone D-isomerase
MRFLIRMEFTWPDWPAEQWKALLVEEMQLGMSYMDRGILLRMWRIPGDKGNYSIWEAKTPEELHQFLRAMPLWKFMTAEVKNLVKHEMEQFYQKDRDGKLPPLSDDF